MTIKIVSKNIKISNKIIFFEDLLVYRRLKIMVLLLGYFCLLTYCFYLLISSVFVIKADILFIQCL